MGHHREVPGARLPVPLRQVLADRGHVCVLLHDRRHDGGPAPRHLLPVAGLPRWGHVPLEHPRHGGLGLGAGPQHTAGAHTHTHSRRQDVAIFLLLPSARSVQFD